MNGWFGKIAQIYYYDPQSAGINLQSPQSDSTPWTLTLYVLTTMYLIGCTVFVLSASY